MHSHKKEHSRLQNINIQCVPKYCKSYSSTNTMYTGCLKEFFYLSIHLVSINMNIYKKKQLSYHNFIPLT